MTELKSLAEGGDVSGFIRGLGELKSAMAGGGSFAALNSEAQEFITKLGDAGIKVAQLEALLNGTAKAETISRQIREKRTRPQARRHAVLRDPGAPTMRLFPAILQYHPVCQGQQDDQHGVGMARKRHEVLTAGADLSPKQRALREALGITCWNHLEYDGLP